MRHDHGNDIDLYRRPDFYHRCLLDDHDDYRRRHDDDDSALSLHERRHS